MKLFSRMSFPQWVSAIVFIGSAAAIAAGPEDNFPPNGQIPAGWATSLGANAGWVVASDSANGGTFSLRSGALVDDPNASVRKSAAIEAGGNFGAGSISFAYQVSSEGNFDFFEFYIDGIKQLSATGSVTWTTATFPVAPGAHVFKWVYAKDESNAAGSDAAWIDTVVLPAGTAQQLLSVTSSGFGTGTIVSSPAGINCGGACSGYFATGSSVTITAATSPGNVFTGWTGNCSGTSATCTLSMAAARSVTAAFNFADDNFPAGGQIPTGWTAAPESNVNWKAAADSTHRGPSSLKSGTIVDGQTSAIQFSSTAGAGTVDFWYKVSSEESYDVFRFYIDNVEQLSNSGAVDWTTASIPVAAGTHVFKFLYQKDATLGLGSDAAWIDSIVLPGSSARLLSITGAGVGAGTVTGTAGGINCGVTCSAALASGSSITLTAIPASGSVFSGWSDACAGLTPTCQVVMDAKKNVMATFWVPGMAGVLDIDASTPGTSYDALTDGLLVLRYLFGISGPSLTAGLLGSTATRTDPAAIKSYLDSKRQVIDIDGNGSVDALTDGLLILRYMFGLRGNALIGGAMGANASRTTALAIESYLQSLMP